MPNLQKISLPELQKLTVNKYIEALHSVKQHLRKIEDALKTVVPAKKSALIKQLGSYSTLRDQMDIELDFMKELDVRNMVNPFVINEARQTFIASHNAAVEVLAKIRRDKF